MSIISKDSDLKVIFFEPTSAGKEGVIIADGYFSFVPSFKEGDSINITRSAKGTKNTAASNPISHKTHRVLATDWVVTVNDSNKEAVATLIVSVAKIEADVATQPDADPFPSVVATHA